MATKQTLSTKQLKAITKFAKDNGRNWKRELRLAWETGNYAESEDSASLQTIRNNFGPSWLASFRLHNTPVEIDKSGAVTMFSTGHIPPPDPDEQNEDRAAWAGAAVSAFMATTGTDIGSALSDLLSDLMHWADRNDTAASGSFPLALRRAREHYRAETDGLGTQSANFSD